MKFKTKQEKIKHLEKELKRYKDLSLHDTLTGLYNRRKLEHDLERYLEIQKRHKTNFVVMLLDINNFKAINDTKGHNEGDRTLKSMAQILKKSIRKYEKVYRLSGDEFVVILSHHHRYKIPYIIKRIKRKLKKENITISIGYNKLCKDVLEIADTKMYKDKRKWKT